MTPPTNPESVRQEHIDFIATKIMGWEKTFNEYGIKFWCEYKGPHGRTPLMMQAHLFNPFTKIEHAKMLDGWLVENKCMMETRFYLDWIRVCVFIEPFNKKCVMRGEIPEPFARTCSIMKACLEMEGEK